MNNLLPVLPSAFSDAKVAERTTASKTWLPSRADPGDDKNIPFGLDAAFTKGTDGKGTRYLTSMPPVLDPNHRNLEVVYRFDDPSPLSSSERGILPETSHIAMPKEQGMLRQSAPSRGKKYADGDEPLLLQVNNLLEGDLEVYIQRASAMQLSVLRPNMKCERCLTDTKGLPSHKKDGKEYPPLAVLFSTVLKISAVITGRHEVRAFHFAPGQIGIEVEMLYQRLICTRVVPGSQAHIHEEALNGSEILSVNGARVVSLDEFQHTVLAAYESGSVVIGAAAYKTTAEHAKHKKDFAHFIGSTKVEFKSLLSNMMRSGLDKDHQHDIGPSKHGDDDDDDDDDSSSSSSSSSASTGSLRPSGDAEAKPQMDGCAQPDRDADEEAHGAGGEEDDPEEDERRHNSDSDSDEDNKISIRKAPQQAKRVYAGNEDGDEGGMLVAGRNTKDHMDALYSPRDDDKIQPVDPADVLEMETSGDDDEQEAILVVTEAKPTVITHETKETWDYTTALELEEAIPYSTLVCVPRHFQKSLVSNIRPPQIKSLFPTFNLYHFL